MRSSLNTSVRALLGAMNLAALLGAAEPAPPGELLAEAQAAEQQGQRALARSKLERLLDEHDGTPEAVTGANDLLHILYAQWTDRSATAEQVLAAFDALASRTRRIARSKTYARADAAVLRRDVLTFATWVGASLASANPPKCAEHDLDVLAWLAPDDPGFPSILMHAALCLDAAGMPTEAVVQAERVLAEYPRHDAARLARPLLARIALAHARFAEAAGHAEAHARRYPDDPDTPDLLADAYTIRRGLGDDTAAQDALERHARAPTPGDPERAAAMFHARIARGWPLDDAEAYLRRHREHMTLDQQIVLAASVAQLRWRGACDKGLLHDLCISVVRPGGTILCEYENYAGRLRRLKAAVAKPRAAPPRPSPQRCIHEKTQLFLFPRDRKRAASAQRELARLVAAAASVEVPEHDPQRRQRLDDTLAMAAVYAADQRLEALLAIDLPAGLSFTVDEHPRGAAGQRRHTQQLQARASSLRRLAAHQEHMQQLASALEHDYLDIATNGRSPTWAVVALARVGQLAEFSALAAASDLLRVAGPDQANEHCELVQARFAQLHRAATEANARCVAQSTATGVFPWASRECEAELTEHEPRRFPPLAELFGAGETMQAAPPAAAGVQLDPAGDDTPRRPPDYFNSSYGPPRSSAR